MFATFTLSLPFTAMAGLIQMGYSKSANQAKNRILPGCRNSLVV
jgi:hypothetical protein